MKNIKKLKRMIKRVERNEIVMFRCETCPYVKKIRRFGRCDYVFCEHPKRDYITNYFREHRIAKAVGFLGYVSLKGVFPVKRSPSWCPLKNDEAIERKNNEN